MAHELTVLSFGGGQDSTAILYKLIFDSTFRQRYAPGRLVVVFSDTGNEHADTYKHLEEIKSLCREHGVELHHLTPDRGFHGVTWQSLVHQWRANNTIGSVAYPKSCTDHLKIRPIYKWLESWIGENYGFEVGRKKALYSFTARYQKIRVLLGIAQGEEKRVGKSESDPPWMRRCVEKCFPLIDCGMDRKACQDYIRGLGLQVPPPSNCVFCPFKSPAELLWTARRLPTQFSEWKELERAKLEANMSLNGKNFGVYGRKTLNEALLEAEKKFGHLSDQELDDYRMSHGHCVASRY
jgi:hypothetical protein